MSRKITVRNHDHPIYRLSDFLLNVKSHYRKLSTKELDDCVNIQFAKLSPEERDATEHPEHRHQKLDFLLKVAEKQFKDEWHKVNGWPWEDCKDPLKLQQHFDTRLKQKDEEERAKRMTCPACRSTKAREDMLVCEECWNLVDLDERKKLHDLTCKRVELEAKKEDVTTAKQEYYQTASAIVERLFQIHVEKRVAAEAAEDAAEEQKQETVPADAAPSDKA